MVIHPADLTAEAIQPLIDHSLAEGHEFIARLWRNLQTGDERYDPPAALLLTVQAHPGGPLLAVGGLHPDPYLNQPHIARIRHVYVHPDHRRDGVGRALLTALIDHARSHYTVITLRTLTPTGAAFFQSLGFLPTSTYPNTTHAVRATHGSPLPPTPTPRTSDL